MAIDGKKTQSCAVPNIPEIDWESLSPSIQKLTDSPSFHLQIVIHMWEKGLQDLLIDYDLTNTQFKMLTGLMVLTKDRPTITQMDVANLLNADKMMVSEVLRTLEKKGYLARVRHPVDRRAKSLIVTEKGREVVESAVQRVVKFDETFFSPFGNERENFNQMLKRLIQ